MGAKKEKKKEKRQKIQKVKKKKKIIFFKIFINFLTFRLPKSRGGAKYHLKRGQKSATSGVIETHWRAGGISLPPPPVINTPMLEIVSDGSHNGDEEDVYHLLSFNIRQPARARSEKPQKNWLKSLVKNI